MGRGQQLDLAHWIIHREEEGFDVTETVADLISIRRGLEQIEQGQTLSTEEALDRLNTSQEK